MRILLVVMVQLFFSLPLLAQSGQKDLVNGNKLYNTRKYANAEQKYRQSQSAYNTGNAVYRQYQTGESVVHYQKALKSATTKEEKHRILHNLGNALMKQKNYQQAVEAYKNALRNNPYDDETRYNYALAKQMLKDNQQNNDNQQDQNQDNKDDKNQQDNQNQDQQDDQKNQDKQDQNQDNQDNKDNQQDKQDKKEENQPKDPEQQKQDQQKQQMDNMLQALDNHEKEVRKRVREKDRKEEGQPVRVPNNKDW